MPTLKLKFRLLTIIGLTALIILSVTMIAWTITAFIEKYKLEYENIVFPFFILTTVFLTFLILIFFSLKNVSISDNYIEYSYTLFPFKTYKVDRRFLDGMSIVIEKRQSVIGVSKIPMLINFSDKEAIWILNKKKFYLRISSIMYENYVEAKTALHDLNKLNIKIETSFEQQLFMAKLKKLK